MWSSVFFPARVWTTPAASAFASCSVPSLKKGGEFFPVLLLKGSIEIQDLNGANPEEGSGRAAVGGDSSNFVWTKTFPNCGVTC
jgi:hypothetical protein